MSTVVAARSAVIAGVSSADVGRLPETIALAAPPWVSAPNADARAFARLALTLAGPHTRTLDLGTGSGLLGLCLAKLGWPVVSTDVSMSAVRAARANAARHGVDLDCRRADLLSGVEGPFDLVVFNPPFTIVRDNAALNVLKYLVRRSRWVQRRVGASVPQRVVDFHCRLLGRLLEQARTRLAAGGAVLLHVYESEVAELIESLPADVLTDIHRDPALALHGTLGLMLRFERPAVIAPAPLESLAAGAAA